MSALSNSSSHFTLGGLKWQQPGWRIEQRYSPGVLIGNWAEDRYKVFSYMHECMKHLVSIDNSIASMFRESCDSKLYIYNYILQFKKGTEFGNSTNREAFQTYCSKTYSPDVTTRRKGLLRNDVSDIIFTLCSMLCKGLCDWFCLSVRPSVCLSCLSMIKKNSERNF